MEVRPPPESVRIWFVGWQVECGRVGSDCEYLNGGWHRQSAHEYLNGGWHRQSAQVTKVVGTAGGKLRDGGAEERWMAPGEVPGRNAALFRCFLLGEAF